MKQIFLATAFALAVTTTALAHAQLQSASPPVGGTVDPPSQIALTFSEGVEPAFSSIAVSGPGGVAPVSKASVAPGDNKVLMVKLSRKLAAGEYIVKWRAVSVDTHHTQGDFTFTVK